jgi:hypothetical protein
MCQPGTERNRFTREIAVGLTLAALLAGCSDLYLDRRDAIGVSAGDAVAANAIEQMRDPWPPNSGNTNIAFNGQKMQSAIERYRNNKVTPPVDPMALEGNVSPATQVNVSQSSGSSSQSGGSTNGNSGQ